MQELQPGQYDLKSILEWLFGGVAFLASIVSAAIGSGKLLQRLDYVTQTSNEQREKLENMQQDMKGLAVQLEHVNDILHKLLDERLCTKNKTQ